MVVSADVGPQMDGKSRTIWLDEIAAVVFAMTRYQVGRRQEVTMEAFTLCLRLFDGSILPVVEASPRKRELFLLAEEIAAAAQAPLEQAGLGVEL
jgi:hypothetical protein